MSMGPLSYFLRPSVLNLNLPAATRGRTNSEHPLSTRTSPPRPETRVTARGHLEHDPAAELRSSIQDLYVTYVTPDGVDYAALVMSDEFAAYKEAAALLTDMNVAALLQDDQTRIAFFANLYNALTIHAFAELGPPASNALARHVFNSQASYNVGGHTVSLSDIENGILRRNQGVSMWPRPFGARDDARLSLMVERVDPRIHFVLNCGAMSCPPIRFLTAEKLDDQLSLAARAFFSNPNNFSLEHGPDNSSPLELHCDGSLSSEGTRHEGYLQRQITVLVTLSAIMRWYKLDFAPDGSNYGLLRFVADAADEADSRTARLRAILREDLSASCIRLQYAPYDWSLNSYKASPTGT